MKEIEPTSRLSPQQRRQALLEAAKSVFFEQGFADARIDDIISLCGGSKRSIYKEFGGKEGLFLTLISEEMEALSGSLDIYAKEPLAAGDLETALKNVAGVMLDRLLLPDILKMRRLVMAEGARFPDLLKSFPQRGPEKVKKVIAGLLRLAMEPEAVSFPDPEMAADMFMGMLESDLVFHVSLNLRERPDKAELERRVGMAVDIFLNGIRGSAKKV